MIRLALVGVGHWGKNYLTVISQLKNCRITHICAQTEKTLSKFASSFQKTTDYREWLTDKTIDGVIIATPAVTHFLITKDFINHGIPVLVEKPFTTNLKDAVLLKKLADKYKSQVMVGHEYLYNPAYLKLKQIFPQLGKLQFVSCEAGNWGPFRQDVSTLWDWGPHDVAMLIDLFGVLPKYVQAQGDDDIVKAQLNFPKATSFIKLNRKLNNKVRKLIAVGIEKSYLYDERAENKLMIFTDSANFRYPKDSALKQEITAFIALIENQKPPPTDIEHAVQVIRVLDALEKSMTQSGRTVFVT